MKTFILEDSDLVLIDFMLKATRERLERFAASLNAQIAAARAQQEKLNDRNGVTEDAPKRSVPLA